MKYASRKTIARLSRREVEDQIEDKMIELPPLNTRKPVWWSDEYDPFLTDSAGMSQEQYDAALQQRREEWQREQENDVEHPGARAALLRYGIEAAVRRAGLEELNAVLKAHLSDPGKPAYGLPVWKPWALRTGSRSAREEAVRDDLLKKEEGTER